MVKKKINHNFNRMAFITRFNLVLVRSKMVQILSKNFVTWMTHVTLMTCAPHKTHLTTCRTMWLCEPLWLTWPVWHTSSAWPANVYVICMTGMTCVTQMTQLTGLNCWIHMTHMMYVNPLTHMHHVKISDWQIVLTINTESNLEEGVWTLYP